MVSVTTVEPVQVEPVQVEPVKRNMMLVHLDHSKFDTQYST